MQVGAADRHLLPHPPRQLLRHRVALLLQLELAEQRLAPRLEIVHAIGRGDELEVLPDRQRVEELGVVGDIGQLALGRDRVVDDVVPGDEEPAARRPDDARQRPEGRRLAGAVGPEQPEDRPGGTSKLSPSTATVSRYAL